MRVSWVPVAGAVVMPMSVRVMTPPPVPKAVMPETEMLSAAVVSVFDVEIKCGGTANGSEAAIDGEGADGAINEGQCGTGKKVDAGRAGADSCISSEGEEGTGGIDRESLWLDPGCRRRRG